LTTVTSGTNKLRYKQSSSPSMSLIKYDRHERLYSIVILTPVHGECRFGDCRQRQQRQWQR
jgi:hypothetical protein